MALKYLRTKHRGSTWIRIRFSFSTTRIQWLSKSRSCLDTMTVEERQSLTSNSITRCLMRSGSSMGHQMALLTQKVACSALIWCWTQCASCNRSRSRWDISNSLSGRSFFKNCPNLRSLLCKNLTWKREKLRKKIKIAFVWITLQRCLTFRWMTGIWNKIRI